MLCTKCTMIDYMVLPGSTTRLVCSSCGSVELERYLGQICNKPQAGSEMNKYGIATYRVYHAEPLFGVGHSKNLKILIDGVPTNVPPKLDCQVGDTIAVFREATVVAAENALAALLNSETIGGDS